jgi:hypothetical protein
MNNNTKIKSLKKKLSRSLSLLLIIFMSSFFISFLQLNANKIPAVNESTPLKIYPASDPDTLFQGYEPALNITDYGNLYKYNQEVSVNNQQELNLTYYLDETHDWKASQTNISVNFIQDTRNWVNNSGFNAPIIFRVYEEAYTSHPYSAPHNPSSIVNTIIGPAPYNPTYMRAHFTQISFEKYYDYLYILDSDDNYYLITDVNASTSRYNVYSPWIPGDTMKLTYRADNSLEYYGYHMDYYEYVNESSNFDINSETWGFNYAENGVSGTNVYGSGECGNATAMYVGLYGEYKDYYEFDYTKGAFSELYQNITHILVLITTFHLD